MPSLCALNCAVRSLRWPWNLCENRVLRSAQALRHCRLCCSRMYWCWGKSLLRCLASAVVARRRFVCSVRKKKRSQCQHRCRRPHAPSHSYVSPGQVRPRPQSAMSQPVFSFSLSLWKVLESLVAQHRLAAVRSSQMQIQTPGFSASKRFARTTARSTAQGEKDSRDQLSRTNCLQSTRVQLKGKHRRQRVR